MNIQYHKKMRHFLALVVAGMLAFCIINVWKKDVLANAHEQEELVKLPPKIEFIYFLRNNALFEIMDKTAIISNLYGDNFDDVFVSLQPFENVVRAVESAYAEYSIVEGHEPSRVRLAKKTKPIVYEKLLKNYPKLLAQVPVRSKEICQRYGIY